MRLYSNQFFFLMQITEIIERLKNLDLKTYPKAEIESLFDKIGKIGHIQVVFHAGKEMIRARPNDVGERFEKRSDYLFKPQNRNTTFQRASTPDRTMFYATVVPDNLEPGELDNMRVIGLAETFPFLKDKTKSGYQKISFGKWVVTEDIHLIAIIQKDKYYQESGYTRELADGYGFFIQTVPEIIRDRSLAFTTFLADEFSKDIIRGDFDYLISALFTENVVNRGFDGVLYPSVQVGGKGFNVAIKPEATKKLMLTVAGECSIYKLREQIVMGNDAIALLNGSETEFKLVDIDRKEKECLEILGVRSIEDLI